MRPVRGAKPERIFEALGVGVTLSQLDVSDLAPNTLKRCYLCHINHACVCLCNVQFAKQFLERGNKVVATVRRREAGKDLEALGAGVTVTQLDVSDPTSIAAWADDVRAAASGHVDVLINNAGVTGAATHCCLCK